MLVDILLIAVVGMVAGLVSIPFGFTLTSNPWVVYFGNALGSLVAAIIFLYFSDKIIRRFFNKKELSPESVEKVRKFIGKHGIRLFGLVCPLFPGVTIGVPAAMVLGLDMRIFKKWLFVGIFLVSAGYVFGYYFTVVK